MTQIHETQTYERKKADIQKKEKLIMTEAEEKQVNRHKTAAKIKHRGGEEKARTKEQTQSVVCHFLQTS